MRVFRATVRARGNGGGAAASVSAEGDALYGAGLGVPTTEMKRPQLRVSAKPGPVIGCLDFLRISCSAILRIPQGRSFRVL